MASIIFLYLKHSAPSINERRITLADSHTTKKALANALKECMQEESFCKISVSDLCEKCHMNRKSFYYHFRDKFDLLNWIFENDFNEILAQESDIWEVTEALCMYLIDNRSFFKKAMKIEGQNCFCTYFKDSLTDYYSKKFEEMYFCDDRFKARFYADSVVMSIARWLSRSDYHPEELVEKLKDCLS